MKKIITKPKKENTFSPSKYANEEEKQIPPHPTPQIPGISPPTPSGGHSRNNPAGIAQKSKRIFKKKNEINSFKLNSIVFYGNPEVAEDSWIPVEWPIIHERIPKRIPNSSSCSWWGVGGWLGGRFRPEFMKFQVE